jgi:hypothetical protein
MIGLIIWKQEMTRLKQYINEEYLKILKVKHIKFEIFVNPSVKEMKEASVVSQEIRFTADNKDKKVYAWDALAAIHNDVWKIEIGQGRNFTKASCDTVLHGQCQFKGGKFIMNYSDEIHYQKGRGRKFSISDLIEDFKWVNRYINIETYLNKIMRKNYYD